MKLRLEQAQECLDSAVLLWDAESYKAAANRSYYCIFQSMRAVLALDCFDSKRHSGIMSEFRKKYIKTGIIPTEYSQIIEQSFDVRNSSDYEDYYVISKSDVAEQIENARAFLNVIEEYIKTLQL